MFAAIKLFLGKYRIYATMGLAIAVFLLIGFLYATKLHLEKDLLKKDNELIVTKNKVEVLERVNASNKAEMERLEKDLAFINTVISELKTEQTKNTNKLNKSIEKINTTPPDAKDTCISPVLKETIRDINDFRAGLKGLDTKLDTSRIKTKLDCYAYSTSFNFSSSFR